MNPIHFALKFDHEIGYNYFQIHVVNSRSNKLIGFKLCELFERLNWKNLFIYFLCFINENYKSKNLNPLELKPHVRSSFMKFMNVYNIIKD